jgi:hypothetical protein
MAQDAKWQWVVDIKDMQLHVTLNDQRVEVLRVGVQRTSPHARVLIIAIDVRDGSLQHALEVMDQGKTADYDIEVGAYPGGDIMEIELTDCSGDE